MIITHRIPWAMPYGYTEVIQDDAHGLLDADTGQPVPFDYARAAQAARDMEAAVSGVDRLPPPPEYPDDPGPQEPAARPTQAPQNSRPSGTSGGAASASSKRGSGLYCPDHAQIELIETKAEYQEYDDGPNGERIPAKFFCPAKENGTGKNHSVWRSRAVAL